VKIPGGFQVKILVSWSSGKDSAWMLHVIRTEGIGEPAALLTSINEQFDRVSMHGVRSAILRAQAAAAGLPLITVPLPFPCANEVYEHRMGEVVRAAVADGFTHVAFGDLFLEDVRKYREDRLAGTGLAPLFPLWGRPTRELSREMIDEGLEARLTCVNPAWIPRELAGRAYDARLLEALPARADPCGERGEFHTCVTAGPMFSTPLRVEAGEIVERDGLVFADLVPARRRTLNSPVPKSPADERL
jgi:uncharacterized protein (TIGR00290 family)